MIEEPATFTPAQLAAIAALARGASIAEAAQEAGEAPETVASWRNDDAEFLAALNRTRRDTWESVEDRTRRILGKALARIEDDLDNGGNVDTALAVIRMLGKIDVTPRGRMDAKAIESDRTLEALTRF